MAPVDTCYSVTSGIQGPQVQLYCLESVIDKNQELVCKPFNTEAGPSGSKPCYGP